MIPNLLSKKITFRESLVHHLTLFERNEIIYNDSKSQLINDYEDIINILNQEIKNKMQFLYFNRNEIHKILYDYEETIKLNNDIVKNDISNYFYLLLLIGDNPTIINYEYSIDFIINIYDQLKKENKNIKKIILSKIIIELINNYKDSDAYNENEDELLNEFVNNSLENINNNSKEFIEMELNLKVMKSRKIDEIYCNIINTLINSNNNYEYIYEIIKELDLENIYITRTMFDQLSKVLNKAQKYKIILRNDFIFTEEIINFYYILFKYILKNPIYLYNIEILQESRNNFLKIIKNNSQKNLIDNLEDIFIKEKFEYIFRFITDSNYYNFDKYIQNESIYETNYIEESKLNIKNSTLYIQESQALIPSFNLIENEEYFQIIHIEKAIQKRENKGNYAAFIKEMANEIILIGGTKDILYIYSKNLDFIKDIRFEIPSEYIETSTGKYKRKKIDKNTQNIIETIYSKNNNNKNIIEIIDCSKYALMLYKIKLNHHNSIKVYDSEQISISCAGCIELENNKYIVYGEKGLYHFDNSPYNLKINSQEDLSEYIMNDISFKGGIKINDNYIALTSNSILSNGKDKLFIYDIKNKFICNEINGSFISGINGLNIIDIDNELEEKQSKKILLCACKKYISGQKNGIMVIDANIKQKERLKYRFHDTDNFEVNCFCQININKGNNILKTKYFFVGGLDADKKEGIIKLYRIIFDESFNYDIEFLQDIVFCKNNTFEGFNGSINCIIQIKNSGKLLVSCWDGQIFCLSPPNIDCYSEDEENDLDLFNY